MVDQDVGSVTDKRWCGDMQHPGAVGAVQQGPGEGGSVVVAGLASGHVGVMDARSGHLEASWKGHTSLITALHCHSDFRLLTASQVPCSPPEVPYVSIDVLPLPS